VGLLSGLLLFPITGPVHGLKFVLEQIQAQVDAQLLDEDQVTADLMTIGLQHEIGEISDEEYAAQEAALFDQLNAIRAYKASLIEAETASEPAYDPAYDGDAP
jgi:Gas vesicle protein G